MRAGMRVRSVIFRSALLAAAASLAIDPAFAGDTITYTYDVLGRLVKVVHSGTAPTDGVTANYSYDHADNRTNVTVTTAGSGVSFSISSNGAVTEGANSTFTITKSGTATGSLSIHYATANGSAVAPGDYTPKSGTLTFTTAQTSQTVSVPTIDDTDIESAETLSMSLSSPTGGAVISTGSASATVKDDDTPPCQGVSFSAGNASATEGGNLTYTITKSGSATGSCSVHYATANGTAASGSDYTAKSGTLTFSAAQTSLTVAVATIDDTAIESSETVHLNLSSPTNGATIADSQGIGTITDNEPVCGDVSFTVSSNGAVTEGGSSGFTVTKSGSTSASCSVHYATANGSAASGSDYTAKSGTLTFTSAQTSQSVSVATTDDSTDENAETFTMNLSSPSNGAALGGPASATATINDNDDPPCQDVSFAAANTSIAEGGTLMFTVVKSGAATGTCTIHYATSNGSATSGSDYTAKSGTLTFTSTQTSDHISVATIDDSAIESSETVHLNLSSATGGATISDTLAVGSITDNEPICGDVSFTIASNGAVTEGATSGFTVTKTGSTPGSCSVHYGTANVTAAAGSDYTAKSGTLTFTSAQTSQSVSVATIDDATFESAETFKVSLSSPSAGGTLGSPVSATATINSNDPQPNQPPTAVTDQVNTSVCQTVFISPLANDSDPDGDLPLALVSVSGSQFELLSSTSVLFFAPHSPGGIAGTYVVQDSRGAQATGTIHVNVAAGSCTIGGPGGLSGGGLSVSPDTAAPKLTDETAAPATSDDQSSDPETSSRPPTPEGD